MQGLAATCLLVAFVRQNQRMELDRPEPELLDELRLEFGENGRRAVEFLETAGALLRLDRGAIPRVGPAIAYCLREAMTSVLQSAVIQQVVTHKDIADRVVEARRTYEQVVSLSGEDAERALGDLLGFITELEDLPSREGLNQKRLIAVMIDRTGTEPLSSGTRPVRAYQSLLDRLNEALHGSRRDVNAGQLWSECIAIFRQLFTPPEARYTGLEILAQEESPSPEDLEAVCALLVSPQHLRHFIKKVSSPVWLRVLQPTGHLDPPDAETAWPVFAGIVRLAEDHHEEVTAWLEEMYALHGAKPGPAWDIARTAEEIGGPALRLVLRAVKDHPQQPGIVMLGDMAVQKLDASDDLVECFADVLLNEASFSQLGYAKPLLGQLAAGINEANALGRVRLLCHKMRTVPEDSYHLQSLGWISSGSVTDQDDMLREDRFASLLACLVDSIERALIWVPVGGLLDLLVDLPDVVVQRLRAWALGRAPDVDPDLLAEEVERAIPSRRPTGDDLALVDRAVSECESTSYVDRWRDALGTAPTVEQAGAARSTETVPPEWRRALWWVSLLPDEVTGAWVASCDVISAPHGPPGRESLEHRPRAEGGFEQSPVSLEHLQSMDPDGAASMISQWRPGPDDWLVTAAALARTLESAVKDSPARWFASPVRIVTKLHHPTYVSRYLWAAVAAASDHDLPVEALLDVIALVRTRPWSPVPLGDDRGDYDSDWEGTEQAAIELIKAMATSGCTFDDRADDVWAILESDVKSCSDAPEPATGSGGDPQQRVINERSARALKAVLALVDSEFRATGNIRPQAISVLDRSLHLTGREGAKHRALLAPRVGFLRHVLPDWTEANRELLFGDQAPDGLGQATVDEAVKRSYYFNDWLLENFPTQVHSAVERDIDNALNHLLLAMLREIPGYSVQDSVAFLAKSPERASRSGEALGRLLRNGQSEVRHLEITAEFWRAMLDMANGDALLGFGWLSMIDEMDSELWAELTLETLTSTRGRLASSHRVAERIAASPPGGTGLAIMDMLVRGQNDPWSSRRVIEEAVGILNSARVLSATDEYRRLHSTLLERGAIDH